MKDNIKIENNVITFLPFYEFPQSLVKNTINSNEIIFIAIDGYKNKIILKNEIVFIDRQYSHQLKEFCNVNNVKTSDYYDIWSDLASLTDPNNENYEYFLSKVREKGFDMQAITDLVNKYRANLKRTDAYGEMDVYQLLKSFIILTKNDYSQIIEVSLKSLQLNTNLLNMN